MASVFLLIGTGSGVSAQEKAPSQASSFSVQSLVQQAQRPAAQQVNLSGPLDRLTVIRAALARNPGLRAMQHRVQAMRTLAGAEGQLPAPELMLDVWQVPVMRPYALSDSQMIMLSFRQNIPAPGVLQARSQMSLAESQAEQARLLEGARQMAKEVDHSFADYREAFAMGRVHQDHHRVAQRVLDLARARLAAGGAITDLTQAQSELASIQVEMATEESKVEAAREKLNGLLVRGPQEPLGEPVASTPQALAESTSALVQRAQSSRPELQLAEAQRRARLAEAQMAQREQSWPMFSVGFLYFAPTHNMPDQAYGLSFGASLPWLWGGGKQRAQGQRQMAQASRLDIEDAQARVATDVASAAGAARSAARRLQTLQQIALPAAQRSFEAASAGYTSGRTEMTMLLMARAAQVEVEVEIVEATAALEHALVDLDWSVGAPVQKTPVSNLPNSQHLSPSHEGH